MDPKLVVLQRELASRTLARRRLLPFIQRLNPQYKAGWVHEDICARLERFSDDVAAGKSPRLMILMPPRHGKSEIASRNFPAWHLGRHPDHEFIACSYNIDLAMTFSRKVKQIIQDPAYAPVFPGTTLDPDNKSASEWGVHEKRGAYVAAGVGGGITGRGAHVLVIDDPVKNAEEADSADHREKIWEWYLSTAYSRLAPGGGVLIIQTWWHDDDLAGKLQQMMQHAEDEHVDTFDIVKYPALAEADEWRENATGRLVTVPFDGPAVEDDALAKMRAVLRASTQGITHATHTFIRAKGAALHPERYNRQALLRIRAQNNAGRWWSALYQQNPVPDDGVYFRKEQFKRGELPSLLNPVNVYIAWDFAIREKQVNDYTVGTVVIQDQHDVEHVAEVVRMKTSDTFAVVEAILNLASRWYHRSLLMGFEDGQIFRTMEVVLKKRMLERKMPIPYEVLKPLTDKMVRARPLQGRMEQGMISFSDKGDWYDVVKAEMLRFPAGVHDDCVDSLAWAVQLAFGRAAPAGPRQAKRKSFRDQMLASASSSTSHMAA